MKKKILSLVLILMLISAMFVLTGCGSEEVEETTTTNNENNDNYSEDEEENALVTEVGDLTLEIENAKSFSEGLAAIIQDGKVGFIDKTGTIVIDCEYDDAGSFSEGFAWVKKDDKYGYIDTEGNLIVDFEYDMAYSFSEGLARVRIDEEGRGSQSDKYYYKFIDTTGEVVIELDEDYRAASGFSEGLARIEYYDTFDDFYYSGYMDTSGKIVIECNLITAHDFSDGLARVSVSSDDNYLNEFINTDGDIVFKLDEEEYQYVSSSFSEGLVVVKNVDGLYGYLDEKGNVAIDCTYEYASYFSGGLAEVKIEGSDTYCYINQSGEVVIDEDLSVINDFCNGYAIVGFSSENGVYHFIDTEGNLAFEYGFSVKPLDFSEGLALVYVDGEYGYINYEGTVIIGTVELD